ncbi:hypothetical protein [Fictibacillus fluitans]|uniref:Uncharacterized protein n=1 Tax=Fictibacillus fluitans TaxID=3058422 RepID=A0ABT8HX47_9BACL|nr:hypothetical protein [Fictibacillus sp. NE201]MDN4525321.1 hypothetical protein [Fictibacillus sp. NE201]
MAASEKQKPKYEVIEDFKDLKDQDKIYHKGDTYPIPANKKIPQKRIDELLSSENKRGIPVIKIVEE